MLHLPLAACVGVPQNLLLRGKVFEKQSSILQRVCSLSDRMIPFTTPASNPSAKIAFMRMYGLRQLPLGTRYL